MENIQEYLKEKIDHFNEKYNVENQLNRYFNKEIKHKWKIDQEKVKNQWQYIKSISDVRKYIDGFIGTVKYYQNIRGIYSDSYDMDLALYEAILAIKKMEQCYDFNGFDFNTYTKEDIDEMFDTLYKWLKEMDDVNIRRAMQD